MADCADYIARGHYSSTKQCQLHQAVDKNKDQTYFLYRVTERALQHTLLPLGGYTKPQVRAMATERGLYTAAKKDSQGICFVGKVGIREFLSQYVTTQPGPIIEQVSGRQLGMHDGAIFYTLGQRHGLQLGGGLPYYVVGKDMARNEVYVSTDLNNQAMWRDKLELGALHWINGQPGDGTYQVRIRHRAPLVPAELVGTTLHVREPQRAAAPGQSVVLYHGQQCLGGGIIV